MISSFKYKLPTLIVFFLYIFWGSFSLDLTLHPNSERLPFHRIFILLTAVIFLFNIQQVFTAFLKNKILIFLLLYVLITAAWANNPSETLKLFVFLSSAMIISIMVALAYAENTVTLIRWLFWFLLLMTLASIVTALQFPSLGVNTKDFGKPRWVGIASHPNGLGTQALSLIWLASNLFFLSKSKIEKSIILFGVIAAFFAIIKADSMTSLITSLIVISLVCYYYLLGRLSLPIKVILFIVASLSFLVVITFYMNTSELATSTIESTGRDVTFSGRSFLWQKALSSAADNLIVGYGFDNLEQLTKINHVLMSHLHNGYIETLVKGGLIASMLLGFILIKTFFQQLRVKLTHKNDFVFLNSGLIMVLLHNFNETSILRGLSTLSIFLLFIIVSTSLIRIGNPGTVINQ